MRQWSIKKHQEDNIMEKKDGGKVRNWQIHNLQLSEALTEQLKQVYPEILYDPNPMIMTGTVVDDPTGRWEPGHHFKSSYIVGIDKENNIIETRNTIYKVDPDTEGQDNVLGGGDWGNNVLSVTY